MYDRMQRLITALMHQLYERDDAVRLGLLASLAGESMFMLVPPGTGKSLIARRLQRAFADARAFSYLMGRFSTPDEVFGPLSIRALRDNDRYERTTEHYLPDADVVFLDEIWKASPPIQNALLTALNERVYRNGATEVALPLKAFIGASNELPEESDESAAFWDRFLVRIVVEPIRGEHRFATLVRETDDPYSVDIPVELQIRPVEYADLQRRAQAIELSDRVIGLLSAIRSRLASDRDGRQVYVSDRRWKKIVRLLRMSALLHDRDTVEPVDCALLRSCLWSTLDDLEYVTTVVSEELAARSGSRDLSAAAAAATEDLRDQISGLTQRRVVRQIDTPRRYRQEYYRLIPAEDAEEGADDSTILAWHGDIDDLSIGSQTDVDIFFYDASEQLTGSQEVAILRRSEVDLDIDGDRYAIEVERAEAEVTESRSPSTEERREVVSRIEQLLERVDHQIDELIETQSALEDGARAHLFVAQEDIDLVVGSVRDTATRLSEIRMLVTDLATQTTGA